MVTSTSLLALCCVAACFYLTQARRPELDQDWADFKGKHGKKYNDQAHEDQRRAAFEANHDHISKHNSNSSRTFDLGLNEYSDMTIDDIRHTMNGHRSSDKSSANIRIFEADESNRQLAATVDWRTNGYVTPVKNQGQCGSCWTFATTGVIEGQYAKATGKLTSFSEQQIVDCDHNPNNMGCNGGNAEGAYGYINGNSTGLDTEACYPYSTAYTNANSLPVYTCRYTTSCKTATVGAGYTQVPSGNEALLMTALASYGPIAIAIDASHASFQLYKSGVYSESACLNGYANLDHAVLLVGYGTYSGSPVWIIKNSWGTSWGVAGYFYMARNAGNMCGVATDATYPTGPFTITAPGK